jgi:UDP-N-acetylmuramate-alanine ligase
MSALAELHARVGDRVTGSDRDFDRGLRGEIRRRLERAGVAIVPQDGSGLRAGCSAVVYSTAVEAAIPDLEAARNLGLPLLHRSELLARHVAHHRTVAVTGTSGKSTVTAMIFTILQETGHDPSLLTGGPLITLQEQDRLGNAWAGGSDLLVIEADESDGSLVRYEPWLGLVLNLRLDHKQPAEILRMFETFRARTRGPFVCGEDEALAPLQRGAIVCGLGSGCAIRGLDVELAPRSSRFRVQDVGFHLGLPGEHNVRNALAAIAACRQGGVELARMSEPLARFRGVARRFQSLGRVRDVEVIDDFAHNPDKIAATLAAARRRAGETGPPGECQPPAADERSQPFSGRVLAVFQPHGYGPTRFLRPALVDAFAAGLRPRDRLWLAEIHYAGGTVTRDISSGDLAGDLAARGVNVAFLESRQEIAEAVVRDARPGDVVVVMGARDPSLTGFGRLLLERLATRTPVSRRAGS